MSLPRKPFREGDQETKERGNVERFDNEEHEAERQKGPALITYPPHFGNSCAKRSTKQASSA